MHKNVTYFLKLRCGGIGILRDAHLDFIEVEDQYKPTKIKMNVKKFKSPWSHK